MTLLLALMSCATEPEPVDTTVALLSPRQQLTRASVDLRGVHPSEDELAAIEADPVLYADFVDRYLDDPRFLDRVEQIVADQYLTRTGETYFDPTEAGLGGYPAASVADSVGDEPIQLARYVVENDLAWSEMVLANHTMADPVLAAMWDLELWDPDATDWGPASYTDGRPHAGVLSMTTLWLRYPSSGVNANRHRANAVSRILLCDDYLARPVSFSRSQIDALTSGDPEQVIADTPTCQSCHASMDPLAAHFFGFWWEVEGGLEDQTLYRPEDESLYLDHSGRAPAYHGRPTADLADLGTLIAEDPRYLDCATEVFWTGMTQRPATAADWDELATHRAAFVDADQSIKELVRSVVTSDNYLAHSTSDDALAERLITVKTVSPEQLASIVFDKTGYRWTFADREGLVDNAGGLRVLSGGIDSRDVTVRSHDPSVGLVLVQERLAWSAAWHVVQHDLDPERTDDAVLLRYVTSETTPEGDPDAFEAQVRSLYLELTGHPLAVDAREPSLQAQLWEEVFSVTGSTDQAWASVLSVVLRDPHLLFY
jgi:hypothetical protein